MKRTPCLIVERLAIGFDVPPTRKRLQGRTYRHLDILRTGLSRQH